MFQYCRPCSWKVQCILSLSLLHILTHHCFNYISRLIAHMSVQQSTSLHRACSDTHSWTEETASFRFSLVALSFCLLVSPLLIYCEYPSVHASLHFLTDISKILSIQSLVTVFTPLWTVCIFWCQRSPDREWIKALDINPEFIRHDTIRRYLWNEHPHIFFCMSLLSVLCLDLGKAVHWNWDMQKYTTSLVQINHV